MITDLDRAWAATVLVDSCTILADDPNAAPTFNEGTGHVVYNTRITHWSGPCSAGNSITERRTDLGADPQIEGDWIVRVPLDAEGVTPGMIVRIDAVHAGGDPDLVGRELTVRVVGRRTSAVLRRIQATLREEAAP